MQNSTANRSITNNVTNINNSNPLLLLVLQTQSTDNQTNPRSALTVNSRRLTITITCGTEAMSTSKHVTYGGGSRCGCRRRSGCSSDEAESHLLHCAQLIVRNDLRHQQWESSECDAAVTVTTHPVCDRTARIRSRSRPNQLHQNNAMNGVIRHLANDAVNPTPAVALVGAAKVNRRCPSMPLPFESCNSIDSSRPSIQSSASDHVGQRLHQLHQSHRLTTQASSQQSTKACRHRRSMQALITARMGRLLLLSCCMLLGLPSVLCQEAADTQSPLASTIGDQATTSSTPIVLFNATDGDTENTTSAPTQTPTQVPTQLPTQLPTQVPTQLPTRLPTQLPTQPPTQLPSQLPTDAPTDSMQPSESLLPSEQPSFLPSFLPSSVPSSELPSQTPTTSVQPSQSSRPSATPSSGPTQAPTAAPTSAPTTPSPSSSPSLLPSSLPTQSLAPSVHPTQSAVPSHQPSLSIEPSVAPSPAPSSVPSVSMEPSLSPSAEPSQEPSQNPTIQPTFEVIIESQQKFRQSFAVLVGRKFDQEEEIRFETLYQRYTFEFTGFDLPVDEDGNATEPILTPEGATLVGRVNVTCEIDFQTILGQRRRTQRRQRQQQQRGRYLRSHDHRHKEQQQRQQSQYFHDPSEYTNSDEILSTGDHDDQTDETNQLEDEHEHGPFSYYHPKDRIDPSDDILGDFDDASNDDDDIDFDSSAGDGEDMQIASGVQNQRALAGNFANEVDFIMSYKSLHVDVTDFPDLFQSFINDNLDRIAEDLSALGLNVTEVQPARRFQNAPTLQPTLSQKPTVQPSERPTTSFEPSARPSTLPSSMPSRIPTTMPVEATGLPTRMKSQWPSTSPSESDSSEPTEIPPPPPTSSSSNTVVVVVAVVVGAILLVVLLICYRRRKRRREQQFQSNALHGSANGHDKVGNDVGKPRMGKDGQYQSLDAPRSERSQLPDRGAYGNDRGTNGHPHGIPGSKIPGLQGQPPLQLRPGPVSLYGANEDEYYTTGMHHDHNLITPANRLNDRNSGIISPSESLVSSQSLLSAGGAMEGDSGDDEADATHNLADEFDQYKDQNMEKMRKDVEGNLAGFDGMMSKAMTKALIDDHYDDSFYYTSATNSTTTASSSFILNGATDPSGSESFFAGSGGSGSKFGRSAMSGIEIEAIVLGEVTDWLKRKEDTTVEERRLFMQGTLNKMVASVRHGVLGPDDASRAIHECAAILGLQLATDIPVTTLIVTGMRKTATADIMTRTFQQFGEIYEAAVASNGKGCGLIRFKNSKSADLAMQRFRSGEIVVQDVSVQLIILKPGGFSDSRKPPSGDRR